MAWAFGGGANDDGGGGGGGEEDDAWDLAEGAMGGEKEKEYSCVALTSKVVFFLNPVSSFVQRRLTPEGVYSIRRVGSKVQNIVCVVEPMK